MFPCFLSSSVWTGSGSRCSLSLFYVQAQQQVSLFSLFDLFVEWRSQCGNWTTRPSQTGSPFVDRKRGKRCQGLNHQPWVLNSVQLIKQKLFRIDVTLIKGRKGVIVEEAIHSLESCDTLYSTPRLFRLRGISFPGGHSLTCFSQTNTLSPADRMISDLEIVTSCMISVTSLLFLPEH